MLSAISVVTVKVEYKSAFAFVSIFAFYTLQLQFLLRIFFLKKLSNITLNISYEIH